MSGADVLWVNHEQIEKVSVNLLKHNLFHAPLNLNILEIIINSPYWYNLFISDLLKLHFRCSVSTDPLYTPTVRIKQFLLKLNILNIIINSTKYTNKKQLSNIQRSTFFTDILCLLNTDIYINIASIIYIFNIKNIGVSIRVSQYTKLYKKKFVISYFGIFFMYVVKLVKPLFNTRCYTLITVIVI